MHGEAALEHPHRADLAGHRGQPEPADDARRADDPDEQRRPVGVDAGLARRGLPAQSAEVLKLDEKKRARQTELQELQKKRNEVASSIGKAKASGQDVGPIMEEAAKLTLLLRGASPRSRLPDFTRFNVGPAVRMAMTTGLCGVVQLRTMRTSRAMRACTSGRFQGCGRARATCSPCKSAVRVCAVTIE